jgi:hypothetical protein
MDPVTAAATPAPATANDAASAANTQAEFQQAFDRVLSAVGTGVVSIALEDLIQISNEDL